MPFKDISYLELWQPFCSAEQYHLYNFGSGYQEERICEISLNLDQWFRRRCLFKIFLIWSSYGPFVKQSETICANLVEGIMTNNSMNLFLIWARGSGMAFKRFLVWSSGSPPVQWSRTIYAILKEGIMGNIHVKLFSIWTSGSGDVA